MSNYVNVTVNYATKLWDIKFKMLKPSNIYVGDYKGLEACVTLDKILVSSEISTNTLKYVTESTSFKHLVDFIQNVKADYANVGLICVPINFLVRVEATQDHDVSDTNVVDRFITTKLPWKSKLYSFDYPTVSSVTTVFGHFDITYMLDADWNSKYKISTDNAIFCKQVLGDFKTHSDIVSAKLEAEDLYLKFLNAWITHANSNNLEVVVLETSDNVLALQTSVGEMLVLNVVKNTTKTGRKLFTGTLIVPWVCRPVEFYNNSVTELSSLVNSIIADKVEYDLSLLVSSGDKD